MTPSQRTRDYYSARGYLIATVERRKEFPDKKKPPCKLCHHQPRISIAVDLWNCFDLLAVHPLRPGEFLLIQTTTRDNHSTRRNKILASMEAKLCLLAGCKIVVQSWRQDVNKRWQPFNEEIVLADYKQAVSYPNTVAELLEIRRKEKKPDFPSGSTLPYQSIKDSEIPF